MKTSIIAIIVSALFLISNANAQNTEKLSYQKIYKHSLGFGAGATTGLGLSYRYFPKKYGFQLNVAPYYRDYGKEAFISAGVTILCNLAENKTNALYAYFGNHFYYSSIPNGVDYVRDPLTGQYVYSEPESVKTERINSGLGFGFEFNTTKKVTLNLMAGYAQYNSFEQLFFTGEIALYYRFNVKD